MSMRESTRNKAMRDGTWGLDTEREMLYSYGNLNPFCVCVSIAFFHEGRFFLGDRSVTYQLSEAPVLVGPLQALFPVIGVKCSSLPL